jgi:hypothetical protein
VLLLVVRVVVLTILVVVAMVVHPPLVTTAHLVVDKAQTVVSSTRVPLVATLTKDLLRSMVDLVKGIETLLV